MIVIWLMTSSTRQEFIALAAMLAIEIVIFLAMKTRAAVPSPA